MRRARHFALALLWLLCLGGCSKQMTSFVHPNVDFSFVRRVAIFPFQNLSDVQQAGPRLQSVFTAKILEIEGLDVLNPGETESGVIDQRIALDGDPAPAQMTQLGKRLGVDAVFFGSVEEYGLDRLSGNPSHAVTATFKLVETQTGTVIWNCQVHVGGMSLWRKLFGGGPPSMYSVSEKAVDQALGTLF